MSLAFAELLENSDFFKNSEVDISKIQRASIYDILEFCSQSVELSSVDDVLIDHSLLSHTASLSLSGSVHACSAIDCRLDRAKELSQFSAFYSDRIYINNFLCDHIEHLDEESPPDEDELKSRFAKDLLVLSYLKPFIEAGRIIPVTPPNYCKHCLAKATFGNKDDKRIEKAYMELVQDYRNEARVYIEKLGEIYIVNAEAPEDLLEHGYRGMMMNKLPPEITTMPRIMKAINSGEKIELSKTLKNKTKYNEYLAGDMFSGIVYELAMTNSLKTSYLSDSRLEINIIKNLTNDVAIEKRNHIIDKYLTCFVPFVGNIEPSDVLAIRENEAEAFLLFRQKLSEAVNEVQSQNDTISEKHAKQIYHDILEPQLARLDVDIKTAKRLMIKDTRRTALGWTAAISFGLYTGFLPQGLAAAAAALGLTNVASDLLTDAMKKSDTEEAIRGSDMYFLWKVKKESEKT